MKVNELLSIKIRDLNDFYKKPFSKRKIQDQVYEIVIFKENLDSYVGNEFLISELNISKYKLNKILFKNNGIKKIKSQFPFFTNICDAMNAIKELELYLIMEKIIK